MKETKAMKKTWIVRRSGCLALVALLLVVAGMGCAAADSAAYIRAHYFKQEFRVPMRDGTKLATSIYAPKDTSKQYPMLMLRTPYGIRPYDEDKYPKKLGPNMDFTREGYIFVYQDVRGCYMSEGRFRNMTPHLDKPVGPGALRQRQHRAGLSKAQRVGDLALPY